MPKTFHRPPTSSKHGGELARARAGPGRRRFLRHMAALVLGAAGWLGTGCSGLPRPPGFDRQPRVGWPLIASPLWPRLISEFKSWLFVSGVDSGYDLSIQLEWRTADTSVELPGLVADLVLQEVDLIVAVGRPAILATVSATQSIPIVAVGIGDEGTVGPGRERLLQRGGNMTGLTVPAAALPLEQLKLLKRVAPVSSVTVLWNPDSAWSSDDVRRMQTAARPLGVDLVPREVRSRTDLRSAISSAAQERGSGLLVLPDWLLNSQMRAIVEQATGQRLPLIAPFREFTYLGGLMSFGPNLGEMLRRAATDFVAKILTGAGPRDLNAQENTRFELVVNRHMATRLGLSLPSDLLDLAVEIVDDTEIPTALPAFGDAGCSARQYAEGGSVWPSRAAACVPGRKREEAS